MGILKIVLSGSVVGMVLLLWIRPGCGQAKIQDVVVAVERGHFAQNITTELLHLLLNVKQENIIRPIADNHDCYWALSKIHQHCHPRMD